MYFSYPQIVLQEVPGEISLALSISGCSLHCDECHSQETREELFGQELTSEIFESLLKKHNFISCVLFYGGEWEISRLSEFLDIVKSKNLKTCLYTGQEFSYFNEEFLKKLDYIKVGRYMKKLGGLNSETTNQKMYRLNDGKIEKDITLLLQRSL